MLVLFLILLAGLGLIILGASLLTDGSVIIARRMGLSQLVIGLTIVAIGTSAPEIVVSVASALNGNSQIALGNVMGSNIFNTLVIIGITALLRPIMLSRENSLKNLPLSFLASALLFVACLSVLGVGFMPDYLPRFVGLAFLLGFAWFMWKSVVGSKNLEGQAESSVSLGCKNTIWYAVILILAGLAGLVFGGDVFLDSAVQLAQGMGVSEYVISVTIIAWGTSFPELATCLVAALKGRSQLALGNVVGSNISNVLLVLGLSVSISPLSLSGLSSVDLNVLLLSALLLPLSAITFKRQQIDRADAVVMLAVYVGYVFWLVC